MESTKIQYQHLYKTIMDKMEKLDELSSPMEMQILIKEIESLNKPGKKKFLLGKLKSSPDFIRNFAGIWEQEIENLTRQYKK